MSKDNAASSLMAVLCGELSQLAANYWQGRNRLFMERGGLRAEFVCLFVSFFLCFPGVINHCGCIFHNPTAGFSLLVFEVS
jgi:hypothetical protein